MICLAVCKEETSITIVTRTLKWNISQICQWNFADDILKLIFFKEKFSIWFKFHWNLFSMVYLSILGICSGNEWLCTESVTNHYLNPWWPCIAYGIIRPHLVNFNFSTATFQTLTIIQLTTKCLPFWHVHHCPIGWMPYHIFYLFNIS